MAALTFTKPTIGQPNSTEDQDIIDCFTAIQTWAGTVDLTTLEVAFSTYKTIIERGSAEVAAQVTASGTYPLTTVGQSAPATTNAGAFRALFSLDPAEYSASPRTTKYRLRVSWATNGTASGQTSTMGLYPVTSISGGAVTLGTVVSGSTVAFANPAINTMTTANSGDFTAPAAGNFIIGFNVGAAWTASSEASISAVLQMRQV